MMEEKQMEDKKWNEINTEIGHNLNLLKNNVNKAYNEGNVYDISEDVSRRGIKDRIKRFLFVFIRRYVNMQRTFNHTAVNMNEDTHRILGLMVEEQNLLMQKLDSIRRDYEALKMDYEQTCNLVKEIDANYLNVELFINPREKRRIIQIVSSLNYGDAVGNDVMAIDRALAEEGYITGIFAQHIHRRIPFGKAYTLDRLPKLTEEDIIIYHFASQDDYVEVIKKMPCKLILRYHNITPPKFFHGYDDNAEKVTSAGLEQVKSLRDRVDYGMIVSEFNKRDLIGMGYKCPMNIVPILIPFKDYDRKPNEDVLNKYADGVTNILFVGRMAPNKKVEDVIISYACYKKKYNANSRLFLVGNFSQEDKYYQYLESVIKKEMVEDVIFPGHIGFDEILSYYKIADVFLCMSEHEGFCVPLIEAMKFSVPIVAYDSSAIPDTLAGGGILVEDKSYDNVAEKIDEIVNNKNLIEDIKEKQRQKLLSLSYEEVKKKVLACISNIE